VRLINAGGYEVTTSNWWATPSQKSRRGQQHEKIIQQVVDSVNLLLQIF